MQHRIFWTKGMRLSDEIMKRSDQFHSDLVRRTLQACCHGNFGIVPGERPFQININISRNIVDVESLDCLGITRDGYLIDVSYDSNYTDFFETRVIISEQMSEVSCLLLIQVTDEPWKDAGDGTCMPVYAYRIQREDSPVPGNALPLARIKYDMGWEVDEAGFVPPCMSLSAHPRFMEQAHRFKNCLDRLNRAVPTRLRTENNDALKILWPSVRSLGIRLNEEMDDASPKALFAMSQQCVNAFCCACLLDDYLELSESDKYDEFVRLSFDYSKAWEQIEDGVALCEDICIKVEGFEAQPAEKSLAAPQISAEELVKKAINNDVRVKVSGIGEGVTVFYSIDGSEPARPLRGGSEVPVNPGFNKARVKEQNREFTVKLKATLGQQESPVSCFTVVVIKDVSVWNGFEI